MKKKTQRRNRYRSVTKRELKLAIDYIRGNIGIMEMSQKLKVDSPHVYSWTVRTLQSAKKKFKRIFI